MRFNDYALHQTARVLLQINRGPWDKMGISTETALVDYMKSQTLRELDHAGFWGTGGFYISVCSQAGQPDPLYATATLMSYTVKCLLHDMGKLIGSAE